MLQEVSCGIKIKTAEKKKTDRKKTQRGEREGKGNSSILSRSMSALVEEEQRGVATEVSEQDKAKVRPSK